MSITFYYGSGSPYAWRVWLALEHKGVPYEIKTLSFSAGEHRSEAFAAINPRCKVPVLVDDGFALFESAAIVEYLDERFPGAAPLFPGGIRQRALARRLIREIDSYLDEAMSPLFHAVFLTARAAWDEAVIGQARQVAAQQLDWVESTLTQDYLAGALSAADYALYPFLALALRVEARRPDTPMRSLLGPATTAWMARLEALPFLERTLPPHWKT